MIAKWMNIFKRPFHLTGSLLFIWLSMKKSFQTLYLSWRQFLYNEAHHLWQESNMKSSQMNHRVFYELNIIYISSIVPRAINKSKCSVSQVFQMLSSIILQDNHNPIMIIWKVFLRPPFSELALWKLSFATKN